MRTVRSGYGELHGCYRRALAEDRGKGGTLYVKVTLGADDAVIRADVERDEIGHEAATRCALDRIRRWRLSGAAAAGASVGSEITVPLTFRPDPGQFVVHAGDVPPVRGVASLLHRKSVGAERATLARLQVAGRRRLTGGDVDRVLYVLKGRGRMRCDGRVKGLAPGAVAWIPPRRMVLLSGALDLIMVEVRSPQGPGAREASDRRPLVQGPAGERVLDRRRMGHGRFYAAVLRIPRGGRIPVRTHRQAAELYYVVRGQGTAVQRQRSHEVSRGCAVHHPPGAAHRLEARTAMTLLLVLAPAAPRRRLRKLESQER